MSHKASLHWVVQQVSHCGIEVLESTNAMIVKTLLPEGSAAAMSPPKLRRKGFHSGDQVFETKTADFHQRMQVIGHQAKQMRHSVAVMEGRFDLWQQIVPKLEISENRIQTFVNADGHMPGRTGNLVRLGRELMRPSRPMWRLVLEHRMFLWGPVSAVQIETETLMMARSSQQASRA